ncbi:MAG: S8 family serine peptidase, partial [Allosphingosinicella sp.]
MDRYFYRLGERVPVQQVDEMLAVQVSETARGAAADGVFGEAVLPGLATLPIQAPAEELESLAEAGWMFVRPSTEFEAAVRSADGAADVEEVGQVFQQADGHILIGTRKLIVQFDPEMSEEKAIASLEARDFEVLRALRFAPNQFEVAIPRGADLLETANALQESESTVHSEPEFVEHIGQRLTPTDPNYAQQWHLRNSGAAGGTAGADIAAERAWDFTRGRFMRVAVIDNGFDVGHADLAPAIVADSGFFNAAGNFQRTLTGFPDNDHGTFCAGMVGARHNNGRDGCGSAPECELMLVAARNDQVGTQATLARAVAYAANPALEVAASSPLAGADVIVSSLGPNGANWALTAVLNNALLFAARQGRRGRGTPIFWASSNGNNVDIALDQVVSHPEVIAVGRSRRTDLEDHSARGAQLDLLAPGVGVVSTASGGGTRTDTGTSFAAPLAAGVGALVLSINPDLYAHEVDAILRATCDKVGGVAYDQNGHNVDYGHGRVNAFRAVIKAMHSIGVRGIQHADRDGDGRADLPVSSPWGIGTLKFGGGALSSPAMAPNGSRFNGWLLNTADNHFPQMGDFDGDGRAETLVTSPWGIGVLKQSSTSFTALMLAPNGTRFGGWLLNTADNRFGPVGDFDGDGKLEILVRSPWGIGIMKLGTGTFTMLMMAPNGTRFGGWLLNTADNH